jgi:hypothetical protein
MLMAMANTDPSSTASSDQSQYDFIMDGDKKPKKQLMPTRFRYKLLFLVGGAVVVLIILAVAASTLLRGSGSSIEQLKELAKQQTELARIADIGTRKARSASAINLAVTTKSTLESDQKATVSYLTGQKQKLGAKDLGMNKNTKTDDLLLRAEQSNQFDEAFTQNMRAQLTTYQIEVKKAYDKASGKKLKALLADNYNHVNTLLATQ